MTNPNIRNSLVPSEGDDPNLELDQAENRLHRNVGDIKELTNEILRYYQKTKGVGHTRSLLSGTGYIMGSPVRPTVVSHDETYGRMISPGNSISLGRFKDWAYRNRAPLLWDNAALILMFEAFVKALDAQEEHITYLTAKVQANLDRIGDIKGDVYESETDGHDRLLEDQEGRHNQEAGSPGQVE